MPRVIVSRNSDRSHPLQTDSVPPFQTAPIARRVVLTGFAGSLVAAGIYAFADTAVSVPIAPEAALARLRANTLILVDIRRPDEWALTGVAEGAVALDMRDDDFLIRLDRLTSGNRQAAIALICARGVRSRRLAAQLTAVGFSDVLDVSEGMLGSAAGPGWIARGLPISNGPNGADE